MIKKANLDEEVIKRNGHITFSGKDYNEFNLESNKQSIEQILFQRAVKTTIQILNDKVYLIIMLKLMRYQKIFLSVTRRRVDLEKVEDDVVQ